MILNLKNLAEILTKIALKIKPCNKKNLKFNRNENAFFSKYATNVNAITVQISAIFTFLDYRLRIVEIEL